MYKLITESGHFQQANYFREMKKPASRLQANTEKLAAAPYAKPVLTIDRAAHCQLHQLVEHIAMHQGFEVGTHPQIGGRFLGDGVDHHPQWMLNIGCNLLVDVGGETQHLAFALPFDVEGNRDKGRIIDGDTDFFHRVIRK